MKFEWNKKYSTFALYAFLVVFSVILCIFFFLDFGDFGERIMKLLSVFNPIFYGAVIAYLLSPILGFFENVLLAPLDRKGSYRLKRVISVLITVLGILFFTALVAWRLIPTVLRGYADLQNMSGLYLRAMKDWLLNLPEGAGPLSGYLDKLALYAADLLERIYRALDLIVPDVGSIASAVVGVGYALLISLILAVYFLFSKERLLAEAKKVSRSLLSESHYSAFTKGVALANRKFGGFLKGQLANAVILGGVTFLLSSLIGFPYYPLVSFVVGASAIIPVFGLVAGTIVGALIVLLADPYQAIWFVLLMVILLVLNKKWLRPHLFRDGINNSSIFMFASLVITTGLLGFRGLILGVPIFTTLYAFFSNAIDSRLTKKGLPTDASEYCSSDAERIYLQEELDVIQPQEEPAPPLAEDEGDTASEEKEDSLIS